MNFRYLFESLRLIKTVKSFSNISFTIVLSFGVTCDSNTSYFAIGNVIAKYDQDWKYINSSYSLNSPRYILTLNDTCTKRLFLSQVNGLSEIDENLKVIKNVPFTGINEGLCFNHTSSLLLVASSTSPFINVFNLNLEFIRNIPIPYASNYIVEYDGLLLVSSTTSYVIVLKNENLYYTFNTLCASIRTLAIDQYGIIALNCYGKPNNTIYLYTINGSFTGQSWQAPVLQATQINFDNYGNLVVSAYNTIYVFSSSPVVTNETSAIRYNNFCVLDSCLKKVN